MRTKREERTLFSKYLREARYIWEAAFLNIMGRRMGFFSNSFFSAGVFTHKKKVSLILSSL